MDNLQNSPIAAAGLPHDPKVRSNFIKQALEAYSSVPSNRSYALSDYLATGFGALAYSWYEREIEGKGGRSYSVQEIARDVFEPLMQILPQLRQERPLPESEQPKPLRDEATGVVAQNPWSEPVNLTAQMEVEKRDKILAAHLRAIKDGVTYPVLYRLRDQAEARERVRTLRYGASEHNANVFLGNDLKKRGEFTRRNDPATVTFYKREAEVEPALPIGAHHNLTQLGQISTRGGDPLRALVARGEEILMGWHEDDLARLAAAKLDAEHAHKRAEALAGRK